MRTTLTAALIVLASPAAADCYYTNGVGKIVVEEDHMTLYGRTPEEVERCGLDVDPSGIRFATCESGWSAEYVLGASTPGGPVSDILAFHGTFWYWHCD